MSGEFTYFYVYVLVVSDNIAPGDSPFPELLDQESGFDLYDPESEQAVTPPDMSAPEIEMEVMEGGAGGSEVVISDITQPVTTESNSHFPTVQSSVTEEQTSISKPNPDAAPAIVKQDPEPLPFNGLRQPPDTDPTKLYCLCQEPATFSMIPCHKCQNWFHGECVGLTRQKAATVKQFFCPLCMDKDSTLVTSFESRAEREAMVKKERSLVSSQTKGYRKSGKKHSRRLATPTARNSQVLLI